MRTAGKKSIPRPAEPIPEPTTPGELLLEEWLTPMNMSQSALAEKMGVHVQVVNGIVNRRRAVTAHTALLLARVLETTPEFWMNAQVACDLWDAMSRMDAEPIRAKIVVKKKAAAKGSHSARETTEHRAGRR
jgi:antitoxin HigA-1